MAVKTYQFRTTTEEADRPIRYYVCDTTAELPNSGLLEGDIAYTKDTDSFYAADSATTWDDLGGGGSGSAATSFASLVKVGL